ncbi:MAG: pseudouridine synthase [Propionibacteriales bacterium]|uniref:pseudouridine synthase n=1 Tax=unclassified Aeromicrobium TaxID=2633570 RepID=UPI00209738A5|nr:MULTISPECIES: pseudouridine synthase [unclassified Aeromicrobium]MCO7238419.1 rRNA pseudouridine synthase [Aeromicrobium sp. CnD17-E]MCX6408558.1 pseudouridine synthase [Propionibacteriales bacterium]MDR6118856.1 23S rRNA pseudouridine2605 synthase [Aeromicrobium sp. SORGH_AS_0981]
MSDAEGIRLQKVLAQAGVGSRRRCEELMATGRVEVNGEVVTQMGIRVDPHTDLVRVDGRRIPPPSDHAYLVLNKPRGVVSSMADEQGRRDLTEFVAGRDERLFHVGRLDTDTSGLLLLTNDGDLAHRLAHPSYEFTKTYVALVDGAVGDAVGRRLRDGIELEDGPAAVDRFVVKDRSRGRSLVELDLHMGRNRIVRRMLAAVGHPVVELTRTTFGPIHLGGLGVGRSRELTREELGDLFDSVSA